MARKPAANGGHLAEKRVAEISTTAGEIVSLGPDVSTVRSAMQAILEMKLPRFSAGQRHTEVDVDIHETAAYFVGVAETLLKTGKWPPTGLASFNESIRQRVEASPGPEQAAVLRYYHAIARLARELHSLWRAESEDISAGR